MVNTLNHYHCNVFPVEGKMFEVLYYIVITKHSYFIITMSKLINHTIDCKRHCTVNGVAIACCFAL